MSKKKGPKTPKKSHKTCKNQSSNPTNLEMAQISKSNQINFIFLNLNMFLSKIKV